MKELIQTVFVETRDALNDIYKKRKQTLLFQKIMWALTGVYFLGVLLVMSLSYLPEFGNSYFSFLKQFKTALNDPYINMYPMLGLLVLLYLSVSVFVRRFQQFKIKESETITGMVKRLFPEVDFAQNTQAPSKEIISSKLFAWIKKDVPIYNYGQIRSTVNDTTINIADIGIVEENVSNKALATFIQIPILNIFGVLYQYVFKNVTTNKSADNVYYTYRGMFCWLQFKKSLNGHTVVLPSNQRAKLDRISSFNFKEEQKIELEDPRFTNQFIVYSTDQVEARYVLSAALMERIVALKEKFDQPILLSFQNDQMYLAVKNEHGLFSFPSGKLDSIKNIEELANDINTALQVASELNLN